MTIQSDMNANNADEPAPVRFDFDGENNETFCCMCGGTITKNDYVTHLNLFT